MFQRRLPRTSEVQLLKNSKILFFFIFCDKTIIYIIPFEFKFNLFFFCCDKATDRTGKETWANAESDKVGRQLQLNAAEREKRGETHLFRFANNAHSAASTFFSNNKPETTTTTTKSKPNGSSIIIIKQSNKKWPLSCSTNPRPVPALLCQIFEWVFEMFAPGNPS